jgi:hypothetical protein
VQDHPARPRTRQSAWRRLPEALGWVVCGALLLPLSDGCARKPETRNQTIMNLQISMTRDQVLLLMGEPQAIEAQGGIEFWLYRAAGDDDPQNSMPVGFMNGRVVGWGRIYYEGAVSENSAVDGGLAKRR